MSRHELPSRRAAVAAAPAGGEPGSGGSGVEDTTLERTAERLFGSARPDRLTNAATDASAAARRGEHQSAPDDGSNVRAGHTIVSDGDTITGARQFDARRQPAHCQRAWWSPRCARGPGGQSWWSVMEETSPMCSTTHDALKYARRHYRIITQLVRGAWHVSTPGALGVLNSSVEHGMCLLVVRWVCGAESW